MTSEFERGKLPHEQPPLITNPAYGEFMQGRQYAEALADRHDEALGNLRRTTAAGARQVWLRGFWRGTFDLIVAVIGLTLVGGVIVGLVAYFIDSDSQVMVGDSSWPRYAAAAAVGAAVSFVLTALMALIYIIGFIIARFGALLLLLAIVGALAVAGLHEAGIVPKFW